MSTIAWKAILVSNAGWNLRLLSQNILTNHLAPQPQA